ncbi:helix-turn-helix domain-containing protein [Paenibacillus elgii]|uniref:helix-turn-helix domain-containing protein n=1 Tax=Paenibacillus elgii TaxID=189691 RepID=UPI0006804081|nr:helix-turn-helix transcriptional regulator [Paenibacillus elgii]
MNEDDYYKAVGKRIRESRLRQGMTQSALGQKLHISRPSVANIEAGRQRVQIHFLYQIASELETTITDLLV